LSRRDGVAASAQRQFKSGKMAIAYVIREQVRGCHTVAFDEHAVKRMKERKVSEDEVLDVLRNPDQTGLPTLPGRFRYRKHSAPQKWVDVIFEEDPTQIVVFSVWRK
jgi:Domain of unknown function (DUF4258)